MARRHPCRALFPVLQVDGGRADFGPAAQVKEVAAKKKEAHCASHHQFISVTGACGKTAGASENRRPADRAASM